MKQTEREETHAALTWWHSDDEGFGGRPRSPPVGRPDFEQIAFPRLQTVHEGRGGLSGEGEGLRSEGLERGRVREDVF